MTFAATLVRLILIAAALQLGLLSGAQASGGGEGPIDDFVSRTQPDIPLDAYGSGELGIVLNTYPRIFLYPAWRAIVLGKATPQSPASLPGIKTPSPLEKACCNNVQDSYISTDDASLSPNQWMNARSTIVSSPPRVEPTIWRNLQGESWLSYRNCPDAAWATATRNLKVLQARTDATSTRLRAWIEAQDAVFEFCGYVKGARTPFGKPSPPPPEIPNSLPATEPLVWRQWRDYQIAASHFYNNQFKQAEQLFHAIGNTAGHPMQMWGEYLALRARLRSISLAPEWDQQLRTLLISTNTPEQREIAQAVFLQHRMDWQQTQLETLAAQGERILAQPALQPIHEDVRATLRSAAIRLTPRKHFAQLSEQLDNVQVDPYIDDTLGDWRRLANDLIDGPNFPVESMRSRHAYFDWMRTLQGCEGSLRDNKDLSCTSEYEHAVKRWHATRKVGQAEAAAWLTAVLATADTPTPELLQAGDSVAETAPEYLTVQYHIVRLLRMAGQNDAARARVDALLAQPLRSISAINLLRRERFALATGLDDATHFILRRNTSRSDPDTQQIRTTPATDKSPAQLDTDGDTWLNSGLPMVDLLKFSKSTVLALPLRIHLAVAVWWRADLLNQPALAIAAAQYSAKLQPELSELARNYVSAKDAHSRRHLLVMASLIGNLSPVIMSSPWPKDSMQSRENAIANAWCNVVGEQRNSESAPLREPNGPSHLVSSAAALQHEIAELQKIPPATSVVGAHVLERLRRKPDDPDLPWLLYVTVQSTRGGCIGPDNGSISRKAFNALHRRFGNSEWAEKTPVWYR